MTLTIHDPRAADLARKLADHRKQTTSDAVIVALENELKREEEKPPLSERLAKIAADLRSKSGGPGREVTEEEMDSMWGHDDLP